MPNEIGPHLEQRILPFGLGHRALGLRRISAELARDNSGGIRVSDHGVWRVFLRAGLTSRSSAWPWWPPTGIPTSASCRCQSQRVTSRPPRRGRRSSLDCFYVGRLSGTKGTVWQYAAIDVASASQWAEPRTSQRNPRARHTRGLLNRVARELKQPAGS
jgi:hypothetical protein